MAASLQRFRLRASVRPRLPCIPRRTHAYCVAARTQASCVAARATVLALAAGAWRHRKQPALCEPPPPPPPLPPLETALAPVASEQPLPLARRLARVAFYALRAAYLWLVFSPLLLSSPLAFWQKRFPQLEEVWWSWCIATLERTGALAIKLAQWAPSRPDLFSSRVCGRLQHLQDHTQPHSLEATEAALDAAFGPGWRSVLRIAPHPVGSGCIAQVRPRRESCGRRLRRRREDPCKDPCKERRGRVAGGGISELACRCTAASSCGMASGGRWRSRCCTRRLGRRAWRRLALSRSHLGTVPEPSCRWVGTSARMGPCFGSSAAGCSASRGSGGSTRAGAEGAALRPALSSRRFTCGAGVSQAKQAKSAQRCVCARSRPDLGWVGEPGGMSEEFTEMLLRQLDLRRKKKADSPRSQEHTCPPHPVPTRAPLGARRTTCAASAPTSRARGAVPRRSTSRIRSAGTWRGPLSVVSCEARSEAGLSLRLSHRRGAISRPYLGHISAMSRLYLG